MWRASNTCVRSARLVEAIPLYLGKIGKLKLLPDVLREPFGPQPLPVVKYMHTGMRRTIERLRREHRYDLVHLDMLHLAGYMRWLQDVPVLLMEHNLEAQILSRRADLRAAAPQEGTTSPTRNASCALSRAKPAATPPRSWRFRTSMHSRSTRSAVAPIPCACPTGSTRSTSARCARRSTRRPKATRWSTSAASPGSPTSTRSTTSTARSCPSCAPMCRT